MTKIYNTDDQLMFEDENLSLKELVEKNKKNLREANLCDANLRFASLWDANLRDANLEGASFDCLTIFPNGKSLRELLLNQLLNKGE